jgi:hypothetical protein
MTSAPIEQGLLPENVSPPRLVILHGFGPDLLRRFCQAAVSLTSLFSLGATAIETLADKDCHFALGHVAPAAGMGRKVPDQALDEPSRLFGRERFVLKTPANSD